MRVTLALGENHESLGKHRSWGFGRVEKVQLPDGTIAARKVFGPSNEALSVSSREKLKKRFEREVRVQKSLPSELFIPIIDSDLASAEAWFTMPLAERTLEPEIVESRLQKATLTRAIADLLNALDYLHGLGYTHRDVEPQNGLLHQGTWKLCDFGLVTSAIGESTAFTSVSLGFFR